MAANDRQVGGTHYEGELQHWDIVYQAKLDYFQAQILRYIMRHRKKHGLKDLQKAEHFIQKYIELEYPHGGIVPQGEEDCGPGPSYVNQDGKTTIENSVIVPGTRLKDAACSSCGSAYGSPHSKDCAWDGY